ncbi:hypothetical protein WDU94_000039 [Cyamophila willieti]
MRHWKTNLMLQVEGNTMSVQNVEIKCGIYQGDGLSPIWFCLALNALSYLLNRSGKGYAIKNQEGDDTVVSHLLYMDDIKMFAKNKEEMTSMMNTVTKFSTDIGMEFGLDKCAQIAINKGKVVNTGPLVTMINELTIDTLEETQFYKYLGMKQYLNINHTSIKKELSSKYKSRLKKTLRSGLNSKNLVTTINTFCIPVLTYSFGLIKWTHTDVKALDRATRSMMTQFRIHHKNSSNERLYLPRRSGGRGLVNIEGQWKNQIYKLKDYFERQKEQDQIMRKILTADQMYTPLNLAQQYIRTETSNPINQRETEWRQKELHGSCRLCGKAGETIQHITTGCTYLANSDYLNRHDLTCKILHLYLAQRDKQDFEPQPYYNYEPAPVLDNTTSKLYWNRTLQTEAFVRNNRPDITYIDKKKKRGYLIDVAHPADKNLDTKEAEKISKYLPLAAEIKTLYNLEKVVITPIIISANGLISKQTISKAWELGIQGK